MRVIIIHLFARSLQYSAMSEFLPTGGMVDESLRLDPSHVFPNPAEHSPVPHKTSICPFSVHMGGPTMGCRETPSQAGGVTVAVILSMPGPSPAPS